MDVHTAMAPRCEKKIVLLSVIRNLQKNGLMKMMLVRMKCQLVLRKKCCGSVRQVINGMLEFIPEYMGMDFAENASR